MISQWSHVDLLSSAAIVWNLFGSAPLTQTFKPAAPALYTLPESHCHEPESVFYAQFKDDLY